MSQRTPMTERILDAADRLFYGKGIRAVGVDAIAAAAGISKRSLYDTYPSKEALIEAYLRRRVAPMTATDEPPALQILALFAQMFEHFSSPAFRGCPFVNAVTEMGEDCSAALRIAREIKDARRRHILGLLVQAGARDCETLACQIELLLEGAIATMLVRHDPAVAHAAAAAARTLIAAHGVTVPKGQRWE